VTGYDPPARLAGRGVACSPAGSTGPLLSQVTVVNEFGFRQADPLREAALARLHELLVRIARGEVARRGSQLWITGSELDDLAHQAAPDAGRYQQARAVPGESRLTTWAYKFVILEVSAKIGRHFWRHPDVPLDAEDWDGLPDRFGFDPAQETEWRDLLIALHRAVDEELDVSFPLGELARLTNLGQVWVACRDDGLPVGMVIASVREEAVYIEEIDVRPAHGRRGLRARLLSRACAWAQAQGYTALTLSTCRDVPWNGPFYRKHGFRDLQPRGVDAGHAGDREKEAQHGLRVEARVFMRLKLDRAQPAT